MNRIPKLYVIVAMAILLVFAVYAKSNTAYAQSNRWVNLYGSAHDDRAMGLAIYVPSSGSPTVFIVGDTFGTGTQRLADDANVDGEFPNTDNTLLGSEVFVAKYGSGTIGNQGINKNAGAANGTWTSHLVSNDDLRGTGIGVDSAGNYIYVTGYMYGTFTNANSLSSISKQTQHAGTNTGSYDMFLAAYGTTTSGKTMINANVGSVTVATATLAGGEFVGTTTSQLAIFGTAQNDKGRALAIGGGKVYVVGETAGSLGSSTTGTNNSNSGLFDAFVMQFNAATTGTITGTFITSGTATWTKLLGSTATGDDFALAADADADYVYVAGYTNSASLESNSNTGGNDAFVAKYGSTTGTLSWAKLLGTAFDDKAFGVSVDAAGDVYITGSTKGSLSSIGNTGDTDMFVAKYNSSGTRQWTKLLGTTGNDQGTAITATTDMVLVAGTSDGNIANQSSFTGTGFDAFVTKYDTDGNWVFTQTLGSSTTDLPVTPTGIGIDTNNNHIFVTGYTSGDPDNGVAVVETTNDLNTGNDDIFDWNIGNAAGVSIVFTDSGDFGTKQIGSMTTFTGTITNTHASDSIAIGTIALEGDTTEFSIRTDNCSDTTLTTGGTCNITVRYDRVTDGSKSAKVKVPNNSASSTSPNVDITRGYLQGKATISATSTGGPTASELAILTTPTNASTLAGSSTTFIWQEGSGGSTNWVYLGSSQGGSDIKSTSDTGTANQELITGIPVDSRALHLRLWTKVDSTGIWSFNDYSFTAASSSGTSSATPTPTPAAGTNASITSPVNASTLASSSVTFSWAASAGTSIQLYWLDIGTQGVGSWNTFSQSVNSNTSKLVTGLPSSGAVTVYVRLWTQHTDGTWGKNDFTYTSP